MKIAVVGAGLMGKLVATQLSQFYSIDLYEKTPLDKPKSAGFIAAAMLAPTAESVIASELVVTLGHRSIQLWPEIIAQLPDPVFFQTQGSLIVAHAQDKGDLNSFAKRLKSDQVEWVDNQKIMQLEAELSGRFHQGLYLPTEGQIDNRALYKSLDKYIYNSSINLYTGYEVAIENNYIHSFGQAKKYDFVFDCRGIGAKSDFKQMRGVRGEVARVYAPEVNLIRPVRLLHPRYPIYIAPKPNHEYVIGATEIESESNKPMTVRSALELLSAAYSVHTGFAEAEILELESGLRPSFSDNEPKVQLDEHCIRINGLYRHGYLLAPALLEQALSLFNKVTGSHNSYFNQYINQSESAESFVQPAQIDQAIKNKLSPASSISPVYSTSVAPKSSNSTRQQLESTP